VLDAQRAVVAVDGLDRRAVGVDAGGRPPARAIDPGALERAVEPVLLELVRGQWWWS
jgi:hypothetical protein